MAFWFLKKCVCNPIRATLGWKVKGQSWQYCLIQSMLFIKLSSFGLLVSEKKCICNPIRATLGWKVKDQSWQYCLIQRMLFRKLSSIGPLVSEKKMCLQSNQSYLELKGQGQSWPFVVTKRHCLIGLNISRKYKWLCLQQSFQEFPHINTSRSTL